MPALAEVAEGSGLEIGVVMMWLIIIWCVYVLLCDLPVTNVVNR